MATVVELPRLSDTMEEGVIAKWHIAVGDKVKRGQVIADVETDKATMEFESFDAGIVLELVAPEGETLPIGAAIAVLGKKGEDVKAALADHGGGGGGGGGDATLAAAPSGAAPAPAPAPAPAESTRAPAAASPAATQASLPPESDRIPASPLARRLAREYGLQLASLQGTGPHGRVIKDDVERARSEGPSRGLAAAASTVSGEARPFVTRPDAPQKLSPMRKTIAKRMGQANAEIPHFYLTIDVDMARAVALRGEVNEALAATHDGEGKPPKVSFNDLVMMACAKALVKHPAVNAYWDGKTIVRRGNVHMGMAVAVEDGLIVPVIRFAEQKTLTEVAAEARGLGLRGRDKQLAPQEMSGSTFTVSNLGMFGIDEFSAVINPGEGAILAVGNIVDTIVAVNGAPAVGKRMKATLACDHRVMDGAVGAKFLATLRVLLERPAAMLA